MRAEGWSQPILQCHGNRSPFYPQCFPLGVLKLIIGCRAGTKRRLPSPVPQVSGKKELLGFPGEIRIREWFFFNHSNHPHCPVNREGFVTTHILLRICYGCKNPLACVCFLSTPEHPCGVGGCVWGRDLQVAGVAGRTCSTSSIAPTALSRCRGCAFAPSGTLPIAAGHQRSFWELPTAFSGYRRGFFPGFSLFSHFFHSLTHLQKMSVFK